MCRLLSICGKIKNNTAESILQKFQNLAEYGNVARGVKKGHKDGWGIVVYKNSKPAIIAKNCRSAFEDSEYLKVVKRLQEIKPEIIVAHLRKASVGARSVINTQPFMSGRYSFCQNGTIFNSREISLGKRFKLLSKGETDSEKLFLYILQSLARYKRRDLLSVREAIGEAINYIRKNFDFTALNMIFSDGKYLWALREVNKKNGRVRKMRMTDYYSLFVGINKNYRLVASEKINIKGIEWKEIKNHELIEASPTNCEVG